MSDNIISVRNLTKQYQAEQAGGIKNVSFDINKGDVVAIIGESGSGKSTLLKSIYGLLKTDEGEVIFEGKRVKGPDEQLIPGHKEMKMVTQDFSLNIYAKVYDNIASQLSNTDLKTKAEKTLAIMEHLRILPLQHKKIIELSGGEQQRVAIAKAMVSDTKVLLLDEPFSQVDALLKNQLRADIKRIAAETGVTVILVSHDPADGLFLADQLVMLRNGTLMETGHPAAIYEHPKHIYTTQMLGNAVILSGKDALKMGLITSAASVVFYPEWVEIDGDKDGIEFKISDIYFKGFYHELLLVRDDLTIRAMQLSPVRHKKNDYVRVNISRFMEF